MKAICRNKIPVTLIPVTVNLSYFTNQTSTSANGSIKILYGGSFAEKDGLSFLIGGFELAAREYKNIFLVLTGKGKAGTDYENIMNLISKSPVKDQIIYKGYLKTDEYYNLLNECDVFCMTRNNSKFANAGFPFKLGEFLATGKTVIATNVGEVSKYLTNNVNALLIEPESVESVARALKHAIEKPEVRTEMGKQAKETAVKDFDSQKWSNELHSVFTTLNYN